MVIARGIDFGQMYRFYATQSIFQSKYHIFCIFKTYRSESNIGIDGIKKKQNGREHADERKTAETSEKSLAHINDNAGNVVLASVFLYAYVWHIHCL
ncbi:hypothetical protein GCM10010911_40080 [Paenibacillus nasutitermitis]|uniref:Uncharacterized protein n=1 Tax=Paenibacillus nasutitermitis TaxID=1652958 RepID=A0A916Z5V2_9BACL|nr:hypothetical protein GCM10010911_40080 [Paenibacillus nasutitermitis]